MELKAYNLTFLGKTEKERELDFCIHGKVSFIIDGVELSDDTDWCVSASAFRFLHSLFENHFMGAEEFMIPHCGHFMVPSSDRKTVVIMGCNLGIDFNIIHEGDLIKVQTENNEEYSVSFNDYRNAVLAYADQITDFYKSNPPRKINDAFDKDVFGLFVADWNSLYSKAKENNGNSTFCAISFKDYDCCTENDICGVGVDGISLKSFDFINFRECAYNFRQTEGGNGNCVGERDITDLSFTFYTSPKPIMIKFLEKNKIHELLSKNNTQKRFMNFQKQIIDLGYTTRDLS